MHYIDIAIVCLYFVVSLSFGFLKKQEDNTLQGFTFYKDITLPALICTIFASTIGAGSSIGSMEKIYLFGVAYMLRQCFQPFYWLVTSYIITPGIERFKGSFTISDVMGSLYGKQAEAITSIMSVIMCLGSLTIQALALGKIFNYFFGIQEIYGILISYLVIVIYSVFGGIKAVVYNDIFKALILFFILPITCIAAGINIGGIDQILKHLPSSHVQFELNRENIILISSLLFYAILPSFDAELVQRYLMARDSKQLRKCLYWISISVVICSFSIAGIAYIVKASGADVDSSLVFPYFINTFLPVGMKGLMIAGLITVIMSMAEANLNSSGLILYKNCLSYFLPKCLAKVELNIFRAIIIALATITVFFIDTSSSNILSTFWLIQNFWDPIICIPAIAGFMGFRTNSRTFIASTICAFISILSGRIYAGEFATISFMFGVIGCGIGFFGAHYLQVLYGKLPKQIISIISCKAIMQNLNSWKEGLYEDYERYADEEPRYNTFLYFVYIFLGLSGMHMLWYGTENLALFVFFGLVHGICILLILRECIFITPWLERMLPVYFKIALIISLPAFSSYILLTQGDSGFWVLIGALSATCIIHIVDSLRAIIYYTIGLLLASTVLGLLGEINLSVFKYIPLIYGYFFFTSYAIVRNREYEQEERVEGLQVFAGAIAHEIKSPLAAVNMCAQNISMVLDKIKKGQLTLNQQEILKEMSDAILKVSKKGISMVEALLLSMRKEIVADENEVYSASKLIEEGIKEYTELYNKNDKITLEIKEDFKLECSFVYMKQVLFNLLNNAFKYGGSKVEVKITVDQQALIFEDNGQGISESRLPYIFKKFYTSCKNSGTGLGLAFCKMVVESMGGSISCKSKEGEYTKFLIKCSSMQ